MIEKNSEDKILFDENSEMVCEKSKTNENIDNMNNLAADIESPNDALNSKNNNKDLLISSQLSDKNTNESIDTDKQECRPSQTSSIISTSGSKLKRHNTDTSISSKNSKSSQVSRSSRSSRNSRSSKRSRSRSNSSNSSVDSRRSRSSKRSRSRSNSSNSSVDSRRSRSKSRSTSRNSSPYSRKSRSNSRSTSPCSRKSKSKSRSPSSTDSESRSFSQKSNSSKFSTRSSISKNSQSATGSPYSSTANSRDCSQIPKSCSSVNSTPKTNSQSKNSDNDETNDEHKNDKKKFKAIRKIIDSESDNEPVLNENKNNSDGNFEEKNKHYSINESIKKAKLNIIDSDSSEEENINSTKHSEQKSDDDSDVVDKDETLKPDSPIENAKKKNRTKKSKKFDFMDTDSDDDTNEGKNKQIVKSKKSSNNDKKKKNKVKPKKYDFMDTESESDDSKENKNKSYNNILDSDSEGDITIRNSAKSGSDDEESENKNKSKKGLKSEKKRVNTKRAAKEIAMQEIHSETQRLIRESNVSLPYHRPKQRSLQDFLNRRKNYSSIPDNLTTAQKVRMFPELISKVVEEKEKEAEDFYKSSESEDEKIEKTNEEQPLIPESVNDSDIQSIQTFDSNLHSNELFINKELNVENSSTQISSANLTEGQNSSSDFLRQDSLINVIRTRDNLPIGDTQKLTDNEIQDAQNKREILQKRSVNLGVTRKLFIDDDKNDSETRKECENEKEQNILDNNLPKNNVDEVSLNPDITTDGCDMEVDEDEENLVQENKDNLNQQSEQTNLNIQNKINSSKESVENCTDDFVLNLSEETENTECNKENEPEIQNITNSKELIEKNNQLLSDNEINNHEKNLEVEKKQESTNDDIILTIGSPNKINNDLVEKDTTKENQNELLDLNVLKDGFGALPADLLEELEPKKMSLKEKILMEAKKFNPCIRGSPGSMINFSQNSEFLKNGAKDLLLRFSRHTASKKPKENKVTEVKVVRPETTDDGIEIIEDVIAFNNDKDAESKPGASLMKLKQDLKFKMASVRNEELKQKQEKMREEEEEAGNGKGEDDFYANLPDEEDFEDEEEISSESEPEENDIIITDKKRKSCAFGDEEAEESDNEGSLQEMDAKEDDEDNIDKDEEEDEDEDEDKESSDDENTDNQEFNDENSDKENQPKKLKRIIMPVDEDSDTSSPNKSKDFKNNLSRSKTDEDIFNTDSLEMESLNVMHDEKSQACKTPRRKSNNNILSLISPVTQLTALNNYNDSVQKSAETSNESCMDESTKQANHLKDSSSVQKKLFDDPTESVNDDLLMEICSGKFLESQAVQNKIPSKENFQENITDSQLLDLCSGQFSSQSIDMKKLEETQNIDDTSQEIQLTLEDNSQNNNEFALKRDDPTVILNDDDVLSLSTNPSTLNESSFKIQSGFNASTKSLFSTKSDFNSTEKFDSDLLMKNSVSKESDKSKPIDKVDSSEKTKEKSDSAWAGYVIASSSDEENNEKADKKKKKKKIKKKKVKALQLSDEENSDDGEENEFYESSDDEEFVDYDSEENEVFVPKKDIKKVATTFLEKEAELSESEWGSDDEDEKGLDKFEYEEADAEDIDEHQVKNQLEKIHMKQLMDEDQRDVRMLQDMLFEDGDLHTEGAGRERKFRWKNIDNAEDNTETRNSDENDDYADDEVDVQQEIELRKMRYEQQKFLEEQEKCITTIVDEQFSESEVFNTGIKVISARKSSTILTTEQNSEIGNKSSEPQKQLQMNGIRKSSGYFSTSSFSMRNMKGSFLARGEDSLIRIAQSLPETSNLKINTRKKNFVFQHLSPSVSKGQNADSDTEINNEENNDKEDQKRKRKITASNTPRTSKKKKMDEPLSGKKLF